MAKNTIIVKSKSPKGFRRAGIAFTREGIELTPDNVTPEQIVQILGEPNLIVVADDDVERLLREEAAQWVADQKAAADASLAEAAEKQAAEKAAADKKEAAEKAKSGRASK